jgi:amidase
MRAHEYLARDATALAQAVAAREVSAETLLDLALAQLDRVQPRINAVVRSLEAQAREQLRQLRPGALAGVPFLLKDGLQDYAGVPTTFGSRSLQRCVPPSHSAFTRRCVDAGLVVFGKTNLPEFGLKGVTDSQLLGPACNPWDLARTPGGSSGGAAAAVAAGVVPMAAGNDGGGSIRIPAACCGLFGLKPSRGRISEAPRIGEVWFGACAQGVISRSVRDSALALDILCGPEPGDPFVTAAPAQPFAEAVTRPPRRLRVGFSAQSPIGTPVSAEAKAAVGSAAALLQSLGHEVQEAAPEIDGAALSRAFLHVYFGQVPAMIRWARAQGASRRDFELLTRVMAAIGEAVPAATLTAALMQWNRFARALAAYFERFDLLLTPTLAREPVRHGELDPPAWQQRALRVLLALGLLKPLARSGALATTIDQLARENMAPFPFTQLANLTGTPAMSVPLHWSAAGLPLGVQFVAPMGDEATLLQLAAQLEAAAPWFDRLSPLAREAESVAAAPA